MDRSCVAPVTVDNGLIVDVAPPATKTKKPSKAGWSSAIFIICKSIGLSFFVVNRSRVAYRRSGWIEGVYGFNFCVFDGEVVEVAERFAYYGLVGNLIAYLIKELGQPMATAAQNVNIWVVVSSIFPVVGAFIADSYLGRFRTILISSVMYFLGMILMTFSVSIVPRHNRKAVLFTALYILAVGEGGTKPCVQTFAADRFDEDLPEEMAKSSLFNWCFMGIVVGATAGIFFVIYLKILGQGNDHRQHGQIKDARDLWRLCSLNQVEEVKLVFRLVPIWHACITVVQSQGKTFFIKQGGTMNRSIASLGICLGSRCSRGSWDGTVCIHHQHGRVRMHQSLEVRTTVKHGLRDNPKATVPMSIWWLLPPYMLCRISDAFTIVGLQELSYDQVPEAMRSMGAAVYISAAGVESLFRRSPPGMVTSGSGTTSTPCTSTTTTGCWPG
ncbi:hypothetical protein CRG98_013053 [Punica granatum]|uniref:Major facilitator superfamily (MFS) profile domain-containing protein n=1 Tax=Punica granatum TaxID=22663 RepID=A0A2I0KDG3_PUNGR|nr:hypothetical protein CRG98_013053 [Punica granatum]